MPEVGMWLEGSGVKHCLVIWLTELPFSHTGVIKVTNELNEDISYFTYLGERETERKKEKEGNGKNRITDRSKINRTIWPSECTAE